MRRKHRRIYGCMMFISAVVFFMAGSADTQTGSTRRMVAPGAELVKVADGFRYTEGPAWSPDGKLYFTDRSSSRIVMWSPEGGISDFRIDPDGANGLVFTKSGDLISCESGARRVVSITRDGTETVIADSYEGRKLNSPNDAWVDGKEAYIFPTTACGANSCSNRLATIFII